MSEPQPEVEPSIAAGSDPVVAPTSGLPAASSESPAPVSSPPGRVSSPPAGGAKRRGSVAPLLIFAIVGFVLAAAATGVYLYDRATQPDRSTPTVTVQQLMSAVFLQNDATAVGQFVCARWGASDAITWMTELADPEARVSWDTVVTISETKEDARVTARVRFRYRDDVAPSGQQQWRFDLVDENGWRVCNVGRVIG